MFQVTYIPIHQTPARKRRESSVFNPSHASYTPTTSISSTTTHHQSQEDPLLIPVPIPDPVHVPATNIIIPKHQFPNIPYPLINSINPVAYSSPISYSTQLLSTPFLSQQSYPPPSPYSHSTKIPDYNTQPSPHSYAPNYSSLSSHISPGQLLLSNLLLSRATTPIYASELDHAISSHPSLLKSALSRTIPELSSNPTALLHLLSQPSPDHQQSQLPPLLSALLSERFAGQSLADILPSLHI
jgi:hypothetical protein